MSTIGQAQTGSEKRSLLAGSSSVEAADLAWTSLYKIGAVASLFMVLMIPLQMVVFSIAPPQSTVGDWFALFQRSALLGLLGFELLMVVYVVASVPLSLALYAALKRTDVSLMAVYLALALMGAILFVAARPGFEMLALSKQYTAAASEAERAAILAAGEATAAVFEGTAFQVSYILGSLTGLVLSVVMLRSGLFSRSAVYTRIASSVLDFGLFIPVIGLYLSLLSVLCLWVFHMLIAWRLWQLGRASQPG